MNKQEKSKAELINELQQIRQENNLLKALINTSTSENSSLVVSALETKLALVMQSENEKLSWWEWEIPTDKLSFDQRKIEVLGYSPEKFKFLSDYTALIHPDDFDKVIKALKEYVEGVTDKLEVEYRVLTQSGEYIWLFKYGSIVTFENGKPHVCAGFVYDITERKNAEEVLYKSEMMLQTVLDNFPGVIFWKDTQSRYLGCNQTFAVISGLKSPSDIVGKTDFELSWDATDAKKFHAEDSQVMKSGKPITHLVELFHPTKGESYWFDTSKIPLLDSHNQVIGVIGVSNDISKLKVTEQQLLKANKELVQQNKQKARQAEA